MQNKLQELTQKLYSEGLSKGKKEAEEIVVKAHEEAKEIISQAKKESEEIIQKTKKEAEEYRLKIDNEIRMASKQALTKVRQTIEELVIAKSVGQPVEESLKGDDFLEKILIEAIRSFNPSSNEAVSLEVLLPESQKERFDTFIKNKISKELQSGLEFKFDNKTGSGFKIGPKGEGYHLSFGEVEFLGLLSQYLKPLTRSFLFESDNE